MVEDLLQQDVNDGVVCLQNRWTRIEEKKNILSYREPVSDCFRCIRIEMRSAAILQVPLLDMI